jgi:hypothetical protein
VWFADGVVKIFAEKSNAPLLSAVLIVLYHLLLLLLLCNVVLLCSTQPEVLPEPVRSQAASADS